MFITRVTKLNGQAEDFQFNTEREAKERLLQLKNEDLASCKNIAVLNEKNNVLHILPLVNGVPSDIISAGSCVKLRPEYATDEEIKQNDLYVVTNMNEWSGKINITCLTSQMYFKPTETVGIEMVMPTISKGNCK